MRRSVDLPAPFSPRMTVQVPEAKVVGDIAQGSEGAVDLGDGVEMDCRGECGGAGWGCGRHFFEVSAAILCPHASIWLAAARLEREITSRRSTL